MTSQIQEPLRGLLVVVAIESADTRASARAFGRCVKQCWQVSQIQEPLRGHLTRRRRVRRYKSLCEGFEPRFRRYEASARALMYFHFYFADTKPLAWAVRAGLSHCYRRYKASGVGVSQRFPQIRSLWRGLGTFWLSGTPQGACNTRGTPQIQEPLRRLWGQCRIRRYK